MIIELKSDTNAAVIVDTTKISFVEFSTGVVHMDNAEKFTLDPNELIVLWDAWNKGKNSSYVPVEPAALTAATARAAVTAKAVADAKAKKLAPKSVAK